jgi:hypothetical protein
MRHHLKRIIDRPITTMSKQTRKLTRETAITVADENGQVKRETKTQAFYVENEPAFVKLYLRDILQLKGLPKASHDVLLCVLNEMNWENRLYLSGPLRRAMLEKLGIKANTLTKVLESFVEDSILLREATGVYLVNPHLFGKGTWKDIKAIRLTVTYRPS